MYSYVISGVILWISVLPPRTHDPHDQRPKTHDPRPTPQEKIHDFFLPRFVISKVDH